MVTEIEGKFDVIFQAPRSVAETSRLFDCTRIELINNHVMIYRKNKLLFKVWLDREDYSDLKKVLKKLGISLYMYPYHLAEKKKEKRRRITPEERERIKDNDLMHSAGSEGWS